MRMSKNPKTLNLDSTKEIPETCERTNNDKQNQNYKNKERPRRTNHNFMKQLQL